MRRRKNYTYAKMRRMPSPTETEPEYVADSDSDDSELADWNEQFMADAEAEVAEEEMQWSSEEEQPMDLEQAAILTSYNMARYQNLREETNEHILARVTQISRERAPTEEAGRLLMAAERHRLLELDSQRLAEAVSSQEARVARNERLVGASLKGQRRREAPTPVAMRHRQLCQESAARRAHAKQT